MSAVTKCVCDYCDKIVAEDGLPITIKGSVWYAGGGALVSDNRRDFCAFDCLKLWMENKGNRKESD